MSLPESPPEPPDLRAATRSRALALAREYLRGAGIEQAEADSRVLTFAACEFDRLAVLRAPDEKLSDEQAGRLNGYLIRRARREPASRIVGRRAFWTVDLAVRPDVLDPRADSEAVIRLAARIFAERKAPPRAILDLGSGSGALLCALLAEYPDAWGVAVDVSSEACAATRDNLVSCGLAARSAVVKSSWTSPLRGTFDLVVSNPPYIASAEIESLDLEVRAHDPYLSLDGGPDGLAAYRSLFAECPRVLCPDGVLAVEFGIGQGGALRKMASIRGLTEVGIEIDVGQRERALAFAKR